MQAGQWQVTSCLITYKERTVTLSLMIYGTGSLIVLSLTLKASNEGNKFKTFKQNVQNVKYVFSTFQIGLSKAFSAIFSIIKTDSGGNVIHLRQ